MAEHGGYRRPSNPNQVSGPGALSKRTDGGPGETATQAARYMSGGNYGDGQEMTQIQQGAAMAAAPTAQEVIPFDAPTRRPNEPVTTGIDRGAGEGSSAMPKLGSLTDDEPDAVATVIRQAYAQFPSPHLRRLVEQLNEAGR